MLYAEWQRVYCCLRVLGIVLLAGLACVLIFRIASNGSIRNGFAELASEKGSISSTRSLPGGAVQTTIDNPRTHVHAVITDNGWSGKHIVVTRPSGANDSDLQSTGFSIGTVHISKPDSTHVVIDTNDALDIGVLFAAVALVGLICATVLAAPLARDNDRLEIVWTKPIDRTQYAVRTYGANIAGVVASQILAAIAVLLALSMFEAPHLSASPSSWWLVAISFAGPIAWYAMYAGLTSWMKRGYGVVLGVAWPVALFIPGIALALRDHPSIFSWALQFLSAIDPLAYMNVLQHGSSPELVGGMSVATKLIILLLVTLAGLVAGLFEWRRVEA